MFDDLREISNGAIELGEIESDQEIETVETVETDPTGFLGMTAGQRFVLSLLLLGTVVVLGLTCLMVTAKIWYF
jgi:hypothetical protein